MSTNKKYKFLIIDDHNLLAESIAFKLNQLDFVEKVTIFNDINQNEISKYKEFDIVLLDLDLGNNISSLDYIDSILRIHPEIKIIIVTSNFDYYSIKQSYNKNVCGYINKAQSFSDFENVIKSIVLGKKVFPKEFLDSLNKPNKIKENNLKITDRELTIIKLISKNLTNQEIADILCISTRTVETHKKNLFIKFGVNNQLALIKEVKNKNLV